MAIPFITFEEGRLKLESSPQGYKDSAGNLYAQSYGAQGSGYYLITPTAPIISPTPTPVVAPVVTPTPTTPTSIASTPIISTPVVPTVGANLDLVKKAGESFSAFSARTGISESVLKNATNFSNPNYYYEPTFTANSFNFAGYAGIPTTTPTAPTPTPTLNLPKNLAPQGVSTYTGPSIIDYLASVGRPSDFTFRTQLATAVGITNYTGTAEQNTQLLNILRGQMPPIVSTPAPTPTPTLAPAPVPTAASIQADLNKILSGLGGTLNPQTGQVNITAEQLSKATGTPLQVPTTGTITGINPNSIVAGAEQTSKSIQDYINMLTPTNSAEQIKYNEILGQLEGLIPSAGGKGTAQLEAEKAAGIETLKTNLANINGQIQTKLAEYKVLQVANENRPITMQSIIGSERAILNAKAADIEFLTAQAQAIQGNLSVAQESVNRAIDLRFSDVESEINIRLQQLKLLEPELTKSEQRRSEAIQLYLNQQNQLIADQKAEQKNLTNYNLDAMSKYPSANIGINDSYQTTQNKILGSREYKATIPTPTTPIPGQPTPEQPIISLTGKPLTDTQSTSLGYAQRMNDANKIITDLGSKFTGVLSYISGSTFFPNILKSEDRQNYEQAQRNFINSILRKESGAAISPSEFDSAAKQYFPQPGDSQAVIDQKTANRKRSINNLLQSANVSQSVLGGGTTGNYEEYLKSIGE